VANPDKVKAENAAYYAANLENIKAARAKYYAENREKIRASQAAYRASKKAKTAKPEISMTEKIPVYIKADDVIVLDTELPAEAVKFEVPA